MTLRRTLLSTAAAATLATLAHLPAHGQQVIKLTATAGHPPVFLWVKTMDEVFIPEVDKRLVAAGNKYKIDWTKAWGGTLIKLGSESKGIADGIADIGIVSTIFEAAKFPMQNVTYYTPFGSDDVGVIAKTISDMQAKIPAMADAWNKNGLTYLGGMALDSYHIWTKFPITKIEDLQGKKLSAPGPAANWVKGTGAVAVAGNLNSYYEDIKSGVSDGTVVFATGAWAAKVHEVAPYVTKVNFGSQFAGGVAVNKSRFEKLPPEVRKAMQEASDVWSDKLAQMQTAAVQTVLANMTAAGAKISELSPAERKRWADALGPVAQTWSADVTAKGGPGKEVLKMYTEALKRSGAQLPRDWTAN
ncbi:C4-dicarboxylate TRAP transporter substrate-binding protein [Comamonadaceae bacterium G21597-S1]|nr:C4-dicarboxylate TRAP transporter substrate-binding protein [Comamonadaceae bacterium G21597-S1]